MAAIVSMINAWRHTKSFITIVIMLVPLQHFFNTDVFAYIHVGTAYTY